MRSLGDLPIISEMFVWQAQDIQKSSECGETHINTDTVTSKN